MIAHRALWLVHFLYGAFATIAAWLQRRYKRQPNLLKTHRRKIPKHVCLNLVADDDMTVEETENVFLRCLQNVASWCRVLGIETLTVYDRHGILCRCSEEAYRCVFVTKETSADRRKSEVEYPLALPLSERPGSRSHFTERTTHPVDSNIITMTHVSGCQNRKNGVVCEIKDKDTRTSDDLRLHIASRASGKPAIASASRSLLQTCVGGAAGSVPHGFLNNLTVTRLAMILEADLTPPDLMIIHHVVGMKMPYPPMELHGFPPWQSNLTEIHRTCLAEDGQMLYPSNSETSGDAGVISETAFCRALDEYAGAEFRLGR